MKLAALSVVIWGSLFPAVVQCECPEGRICPVSYPAKSSPSSGTCDDADGEEIRAQIRRGVADAIEAGVAPRLNSILRLRHLGQNSRFPANSCLEILQEHPNSPSGEYWITNSTGNAISVYCDMTLECGSNNVTGWIRVANINMSNTDQQCPGTEFVLRESPVRVCERSIEYSCNSAFLDVQSITYSQVCGRIIGYQIGTGDGIKSDGDYRSGIDDPYLDGVSLTYGSPRQHIWSFASYTSEVYQGCPCYVGHTRVPVSFVGNDYFCESGEHDGVVSPTTLFEDDPLWDGQDCRGMEAPCCNGPPWFHKILSSTTTSNIELRLCSDQERADEEVSFQIVELYVQ